MSISPPSFLNWIESRESLMNFHLEHQVSFLSINQKESHFLQEFYNFRTAKPMKYLGIKQQMCVSSPNSFSFSGTAFSKNRIDRHALKLGSSKITTRWELVSSHFQRETQCKKKSWNGRAKEEECIKSPKESKCYSSANTAVVVAFLTGATFFPK